MEHTQPNPSESESTIVEAIHKKLDSLAEKLMPAEGYEVSIRGIALSVAKDKELHELIGVETSLEHTVEDNTDTEITLRYNPDSESMYLGQLKISDSKGRTFLIFRPRSAAMHNMYVKIKLSGPEDPDRPVSDSGGVYSEYLGEDILEVFGIDTARNYIDRTEYQRWLAEILDRAGDTRGWTVTEKQLIDAVPTINEQGEFSSERTQELIRKRETSPIESNIVTVRDSITIFGATPPENLVTVQDYEFSVDKDTGAHAVIRINQYEGDPELYVDYKKFTEVSKQPITQESQVLDLRKLVEIIDVRLSQIYQS